jgi:AP2-like factor (ANT lineage)
MKSMNDSSSNSDDRTNNNNNNWLGFSLSPHNIKLGGLELSSSSSSHLHNHYQQQTHPSSPSTVSNNTLPTSFYFSPSHSHFTNSAICYGVPENANFHSPLTVMPLKSDGSLCIMEALGRSQSQSQGWFYFCSVLKKCSFYFLKLFFLILFMNL